jgi:hypothetical protein
MLLREISLSITAGQPDPLFLPLSNGDSIMQFTVILRHEGVDRTYHCENRFDADVLFDALQSLNARIELWQGMQLLSYYDLDFTK